MIGTAVYYELLLLRCYSFANKRTDIFSYVKIVVF